MSNSVVSAALIASILFSCMSTAVLATAATGALFDKPVWRVLWLVCRNTDQPVTDAIRANGSLSEANVAYALQLIPYFESFVESSANGTVDVQITPVISDDPADWFALGYNGNTGQNGFDLYIDNYTFLRGRHGSLLFDLEKKLLYDSVMAFAYLDDNQHDGYSGITQEWLSFIPVSDAEQGACDLSNFSDYTQAVFLERVMLTIHEQLHVLEWKFGARHPMPDLHSKHFAAVSSWEAGQSWGYAYTQSSILGDATRSDADFRLFSGLHGEIDDMRTNAYLVEEYISLSLETRSDLCDAIWLRDYLAGAIRSEYSQATRGESYYEDDAKRFRHGIDSTWWGIETQEVYLYVGFGEMDTPNGRVPIDNSGTTPIISGNRTLVPIRSIVEALGGSVEWDSGKREIICSLNGHIVHLYIDSQTYYVDYIQRTFDVPPTIYNNRTMVPVRGVLEALGCIVDWVEDGGGDGWDMVVVSSPFYPSIIAP